MFSNTKGQRLKTKTGFQNPDKDRINLKQQNQYLQKQLTKSKTGESDIKEAMIEYENIMSVLNSQNSKLHKQILELTRNAKEKVSELKSTVSKFVKKANAEKKERGKYERVEKREETFKNQYSDGQSEEQDSPIIYQVKNPVKNGRLQIQSRDDSESRSRVFSRHHNHRQQQLESKQSELELVVDGSCPFEEMLKECRREPDPKRRKWMRKKLAEYTYKRASS